VQLVLGRDVAAVVQQQPDHRRVSDLGREEERRPVVLLVPRLRRDALVQQALDLHMVAKQHRVQQDVVGCTRRGLLCNGRGEEGAEQGRGASSLHRPGGP
jgi:hypothetical protein